ncbi:G2/mitotic-specific cyclin S13-7 [Capsicum chacoense]|uniref:G2/mitotic-specific cyclin S13-7 n=1 Tax=Capsicum annuum TaxID=4072 RepID=UPI0007BEEC88|nr:G2/mitotic-specific cyclin S13-7 [Capsicum annuum]KAF3678639.1 G2/mitotic-specific cyclin-1 [Capsicum annuum]
MAARNVLQQQNRGEAVPGALKQKNMAGAQGRNRKALGDIGNMVTVRGGVERGKAKALPQVSRPITRSFCAQLLANAQAAAENQKKSMVVNADGPIVANGALPVKVARKPAQKKAATTVKTKPEVIEISPDTVEQVKENKQKKKACVDSSMKKSTTLTSTLTARSKAACGLSHKPKVQIVDIDATDVNNELAVLEYVEDIYTFYKIAESESRIHDYMDSQPEVSEKMRAILIDWLIEVHHKFELNQETLYLTINIVDRYLAAATTSRRELQLVGISAMLIASKYEEIWAPEVNDFVCISDRAYSHEQILSMEKRILGQLEWYLTVPTPYVFLVRFIKAAVSDVQANVAVLNSCNVTSMENMVYFLAELGVMNYATNSYCSSMIAASAVYVARHTLQCNPFWNETLKLHTGFSESQLLGCAKLLVNYHKEAPEHKLKVIYRKYSSPSRGAVALNSPAISLLASHE